MRTPICPSIPSAHVPILMTDGKARRDMNSKQSKFDRVKERLRGKRILVAFSGGVDSTVIAAIAKSSAKEVVLLTVDTETFTDSEMNHAISVAKELELELTRREYDWLSDESLICNPRDRCYRCKKKLGQLWLDAAKELGMDLVIEGTTASDLEGHRPGERALRELDISSPLLEEGITKQEVRAYAKSTGLSVANRPSMACLATRFPYNTRITKDMLDKVLRIEEYVRDAFGVEIVRARFHDNLVRIEVGKEERDKMLDVHLLDKLHQFATSLGIAYVAIDAKGYRTGAMDEK